MTQSKTFDCSDQRFPEVVSLLEAWFSDKGFKHQQIEMENSGILLQIEKLGKWRKVIGMSTALNVVLNQTENRLSVEIGAGRWIDKAAAGTISFFVLWPLAVTASLGAWQQMKMPKRIFEYIARVVSPNQTVPDCHRQLHDRVRQLEKYTFPPHDYWGEKIEEEKLLTAKQTHRAEDHYVLFLYDDTFWGSAKESVIITDKGVSIKYEDVAPALFLSWEAIDELEIRETTAKIKSNGKLYSFTICKTPEAFHQDCKTLLSELSDKAEGQFKRDLSEIREIMFHKNKAKDFDKDNLKQGITLCDRLLSLCEFSADEIDYKNEAQGREIVYYELATISYMRAFLLNAIGNREQAKEDMFALIIRQDQEDLSIDETLLSDIYQLLAEIFMAQKRSDHSLVFLNNAGKIGENEQKRQVKESIRELRKNRATKFAEEAYDHRQVLLCTDEIPSWILNEFCFAGENTLKSTDWKFEIGHPQKGEFYVCHPLRPDRYFVLEDFHDKVFEDKQAELVYLLQSIGASSIHVEADTSLLEKKQGKTDHSLSGKDGTFSGMSGKNLSGNLTAIRHKSMQKGIWDIELQPVDSPHIPEDLVWYHHEPAWQRIADAAVDKKYKKITLELGYHDDFTVNKNRIKKIKGELNLFMTGSSVQWSQTTEEKFQRRRSTIWKFDARFPEIADGA